MKINALGKQRTTSYFTAVIFFSLLNANLFFLHKLTLELYKERLEKSSCVWTKTFSRILSIAVTSFVRKMHTWIVQREGGRLETTLTFELWREEVYIILSTLLERFSLQNTLLNFTKWTDLERVLEFKVWRRMFPGFYARYCEEFYLQDVVLNFIGEKI